MHRRSSTIDDQQSTIDDRRWTMDDGRWTIDVQHWQFSQFRTFARVQVAPRMIFETWDGSQIQQHVLVRSYKSVTVASSDLHGTASAEKTPHLRPVPRHCQQICCFFLSICFFLKLRKCWGRYSANNRSQRWWQSHYQINNGLLPNHIPLRSGARLIHEWLRLTLYWSCGFIHFNVSTVTAQT